jgi:hypothetical protein
MIDDRKNRPWVSICADAECKESRAAVTRTTWRRGGEFTDSRDDVFAG